MPTHFTSPIHRLAAKGKVRPVSPQTAKRLSKPIDVAKVRKAIRRGRDEGERIRDKVLF